MHVEHSYTSACNSRKRCKRTLKGKTYGQASKKAPVVGQVVTYFDIKYLIYWLETLTHASSCTCVSLSTAANLYSRVFLFHYNTQEEIHNHFHQCQEKMPSFMHVEHSYTSNSERAVEGHLPERPPFKLPKKAPIVGWFAVLIYLNIKYCMYT